MNLEIIQCMMFFQMCVIVIRICFLPNDILIGLETFLGVIYAFFTITNIAKYVKYIVFVNLIPIIFLTIVISIYYLLNLFFNFVIIIFLIKEHFENVIRETTIIIPITILTNVSEKECSICLEKGKENFVALKCNHPFHEECILTWLKEKQNCPMCRIEVI